MIVLDNLNQKEAVDYLVEIGLWGKCQMRADGRIECVCDHGVGHTICASKKVGRAGYIHGCDGCCKKQDALCTLSEHGGKK